MLGFLVRRILATIPVLAMVALFVFFMLRLTPGDPAAILGVPDDLVRDRGPRSNGGATGTTNEP